VYENHIGKNLHQIQRSQETMRLSLYRICATPCSFLQHAMGPWIPIDSSKQPKINTSSKQTSKLLVSLAGLPIRARATSDGSTT
jgi:hypothetical protein